MESKTELKVILVCVALIGAPLLGIDVGAIIALLGDPGVQQAAQDGAEQLNQFSQVGQTKTLSGYVAFLGGAYGAYRTVVKSVRTYTESKNGKNPVGEVVE